jgi:flagellar biosynthesis/type III secretory pathway protein FliH
MFIKIVDVAVQRAPKVIDHRDGSQAIASEVEEVVLAAYERAFQVLRPHLRDAPFHALVRLGALTVEVLDGD